MFFNMIHENSFYTVAQLLVYQQNEKFRVQYTLIFSIICHFNFLEMITDPLQLLLQSTK